MSEKQFVYCGSRAICSAVGVNYKEIVYYVDKLDLPAFKIKTDNGRRTQWLATPDDLELWINKQRDKYLKK